MAYMVTGTWWPQLYRHGTFSDPGRRKMRPAVQTHVVPDLASAERRALDLVESRGATYATFEEIPT